MITLTKEIAIAIAQDVADRHRRANGRVNQSWTEEDWNAACDEFDRLIKLINPEEPTDA